MIITDITVSYNNYIGLKKTLNSLIGMPLGDGIDLQIIVVDGGSSDGSRELLEEYEKQLKDTNIDFIYISEPDNGIYNAMNKGIELATGEWIFFLNSGDVMHEEFSLETFFICDSYNNNEDYDIMYGESLRDYNGKRVLLKPLEIQCIYKGLPFSHQSVFVKTNLFKQRKYDESFRISGDYEWFLNAYIDGKKFKYIPLCVSCFDTKGVSASHLYENYLEADRIRMRYGVADNIFLRKTKQVIWKIIDVLGLPPIFLEKMVGIIMQ